MENEMMGATTSHCLPLRPGTTRVFYEQNTHTRVKMEARHAGQNEVYLDIAMPGGKLPRLHFKSDRPQTANLDTCVWTLLKARFDNALEFTFGPKGLELPMNLTIGTTVTAQPEQTNPATGSPVKLTLQVVTSERITVRPELGLDQENGYLTRPVLKCSAHLQDIRLGTSLLKADIWLLPGLGVVKAQGQAFGVFSILDLVEFHTPA
ncbi:hypothetical protein [Crenobacter cavernae]|uniref:Uncharacterized protein n=1 Tax=Crenobacter cavernae TaxID=2290923 RepID=A0A345Y272_9NEIS|nr:hypothetical protein [Crenobacter cavernae]AXK38024.1 hypothetical protein DWG20_00485 [Crenobacter cavernae]